MWGASRKPSRRDTPEASYSNVPSNTHSSGNAAPNQNPPSKGNPQNVFKKIGTGINTANSLIGSATSLASKTHQFVDVVDGNAQPAPAQSAVQQVAPDGASATSPQGGSSVMGFTTGVQLGAIQKELNSQQKTLKNLQSTIARMEHMLQILVKKGHGSGPGQPSHPDGPVHEPQIVYSTNLKFDLNLGNGDDDDDNAAQGNQNIDQTQDLQPQIMDGGYSNGNNDQGMGWYNGGDYGGGNNRYD